MPSVIKMNKWKEGSLISLLTLVFVGILVGISLLVHRFPWRVDLTETKRYSISGQSQKIVKTIQQDVWIKAFFQKGNPGQKKAQGLLEIYCSYNPRIHFEFIDPDRQPSLARQYGVRNYGEVILESGGKTQSVNVADEEGITNGLLRLMQTKSKKVVFLSGHGEKSPRDTQKGGFSLAKGLLEKENYQTEEVNLLGRAALTSEIRCLVIAGPKKSFFPEEIEDLKKYLLAGGRIILLLEPYQDGGFKEWLAFMGITLGQDIIIDKISRVFGGDYLIPMAGTYGRHPITATFNVATFFPTARSIVAASTPPPGVLYDVLVRSSSESWAEFNKKGLEKGQAAFDPGQDQKGPLNLGVLVTLSSTEKKVENKDPQGKDSKSPKGQLLLFGDSDFASNGYFNLSGNGDLFLNAVNYLTEEEALIAIRPAKTPVRPLTLTSSQALALFLIPLVLLPGLIIGTGIWVWRSRREAR
jgi:ABC-type uncharacterized transport system involved in gliding motility auxiliary subunit